MIDDRLPMGQNGELLCSFSTNHDEFWVSLIEKAYIKVSRYSVCVCMCARMCIFAYMYSMVTCVVCGVHVFEESLLMLLQSTQQQMWTWC